MRPQLLRVLSDYGMLAVLLLLGAYYSWVTLAEQHLTGTAAAQSVVHELQAKGKNGQRVLVVVRANNEDVEYAKALEELLPRAGLTVVSSVRGEPQDARRALEQGGPIDLVVASAVSAGWNIFQRLTEFPNASHAILIQPRSYRWPNFLKADNLLNVANQIVVIAVVAIGMTMVIIAGGIDLSVGSLIALSAVVATQLIRQVGGAELATCETMVYCSLAGIAACAIVGFASGLIVTRFGVPPFIVTLGTMLVASGLAFILAKGQSIYQVPDTFVWLGRGSGFLQVPNAVWMMLLMYGLAYLLMERMKLGRYIYAVGGNREAARVSGVPVKGVIVFTYIISAALAGLGGIVTASQLKSGAPTYGTMYELYVIAAVVVGGTSLLGGEGRILGTLIGAFIIAVIQNGMNLTGVESYTQKVVLGLLILAAVLLDRLRRIGMELLLRRSNTK